MRNDTTILRLMTDLMIWQRVALRSRNEDPERGDVPGWVFVTLMSAALAAVLYAVAADQLAAILGDALAAVAFDSP